MRIRFNESIEIEWFELMKDWDIYFKGEPVGSYDPRPNHQHGIPQIITATPNLKEFIESMHALK